MNREDWPRGGKEHLLKKGYFALARSVSRLSTHHRHALGAVIANKKPVAAGANLDKTHPTYANEDYGLYSIHAEMSAMLSCPKDKLYGAEMWIYREKRDGQIGTARPCDDCMSVIKDAGIKKIHYTDETSPSGYRTERV